MKFLLILLLYIPFNCGFQKETLPPQYKIVFWWGQSNVTGMALPFEAQDSFSGAWLYNNYGIEKADGKLDRYSNLYPSPGYGISMVNSFGKEAAKHSRPYEIILVVNAKPGSSIEDWNSTYMQQSIQRVKEAQAMYHNSEVIVCSQQGEANWTNAGVWRENFREIRSQIDSAFGYNTPMIVGGVNRVSGLIPINDTISRVVSSTHDCYHVSSDGLTTLQNDVFHFDAQSQRIFGLRFEAVYSQIR